MFYLVGLLGVKEKTGTQPSNAMMFGDGLKIKARDLGIT
jgi:hypothetical protein